MSATPSDDESFVPPIEHGEFRNGVAHGRFRVVINPALARPYVVRRTRADVLAATAIGIGVVLALSGHAVPGVVLVAIGIAVNRLARRHAGTIVLHLAQNDVAVYADVTSNGVMEVRRAA